MYLKLSIFAVFLILTSCSNVSKNLDDEAIYKDILGYEFFTETDYFITLEDDEYFLRIPRPEDDPIRKFIGIPTIQQFKKGDWDESRYKGSDKYLDILPSGTKMQVVDIVKSENLEVGVTYDYYAITIGLEDYVGVLININSLIDD